MEHDYSILIGGAAGQGSRKAGLIIGKLFSQYGYRVFIYDDYQSLIRGGHNFSQIRASKQKVLSHRQKIDFLIALDQNTFEKHQNQLDRKSTVIYNQDKVTPTKGNRVGIATEAIIAKAGGLTITENVVLVAGFAKAIGFDWPTLNKVLSEEFKKSPSPNLKIAELAFKETQNLSKLEKLNQKPLPLLTGNEATALGAVKAGLNFYFAYPMTPATGILHYLAKHQKDFHVTVAQLENELAVVNAALGAAYTGARTVVGTSGGGFALMTEALSLSAQSETPLVIVESQRAGPATGVPTYTAQGDLLFTLTAGHGDFLRFVIAPGDAEQSFFWAGKILNLAWQYQTPTILLIDKEISESTFSFDESIYPEIQPQKALIWDGNGQYKRYQDSKNGISPLAFPGQKGITVKATSYEHDESGLTVEDEESVTKMQNKRLRKFQAMEEAVQKMEAVEVYGKKTAKKAIVAWGSTKGPAKEAAENLGFKLIQPIVLEPFPKKQFRKALDGIESIALVETNASGQLGKVLAGHGYKVETEILKYNSRPFLPEEIEERLKNEF